MTEHQRRNQQSEASFGDELSSVGPRLIDWAAAASNRDGLSEPRLTLEFFRSAYLRPLSALLDWAYAASPKAHIVGHTVTGVVLNKATRAEYAIPSRVGLLISTAGLSPSLSAALGVGGGSSWSLDWCWNSGSWSMSQPSNRQPHTAVYLGSPNRSFGASLRMQGPTTSFHVFKSFGRKPLWHLPAPTAGELEGSSTRLRDRLRQRLKASEWRHRRLWGDAKERLPEARVPFVRVGAGLTLRRGPIPGAMPFFGIAAEVTNRTSVAFHTDVLHRTCTTLTTSFTERLAASVRLRCNLITFADTTLDAGFEYRVRLTAPQACSIGNVSSSARVPSSGAAKKTVTDASWICVRGSAVYDRIACGVSVDDLLLVASHLASRSTETSAMRMMISEHLRRASALVGPIRLTAGIEVTVPEEWASARRWSRDSLLPRLVFSVAL